MMEDDLGLLKGKMLKGVTKGRASEIPKGSPAYGGVWGQNEETVTFECEDGQYIFLADGDCCSRTYINSIEGPTSGLILEVQEPSWEPFREERDADEYDVKKYYKATFVIEGKGHLDIEYRNESNGYYGGSLSLLSAPSGSVAKP